MTQILRHHLTAHLSPVLGLGVAVGIVEDLLHLPDNGETDPLHLEVDVTAAEAPALVEVEVAAHSGNLVNKSVVGTIPDLYRALDLPLEDLVGRAPRPVAFPLPQEAVEIGMLMIGESPIRHKRGTEATNALARRLAVNPIDAVAIPHHGRIETPECVLQDLDLLKNDDTDQAAADDEGMHLYDVIQFKIRIIALHSLYPILWSVAYALYYSYLLLPTCTVLLRFQ